MAKERMGRIDESEIDWEVVLLNTYESKVEYLEGLHKDAIASGKYGIDDGIKAMIEYLRSDDVNRGMLNGIGCTTILAEGIVPVLKWANSNHSCKFCNLE